jgi:hypothetical protein
MRRVASSRSDGCADASNRHFTASDGARVAARAVAKRASRSARDGVALRVRRDARDVVPGVVRRVVGVRGAAEIAARARDARGHVRVRGRDDVGAARLRLGDGARAVELCVTRRREARRGERGTDLDFGAHSRDEEEEATKRAARVRD